MDIGFAIVLSVFMGVMSIGGGLMYITHISKYEDSNDLIDKRIYSCIKIALLVMVFTLIIVASFNEIIINPICKQ